MANLDIRDEESLLFTASQLCCEAKSGRDGTWQIAPFFCSLPYRDSCLDRLDSLRLQLAERFPELIAFGDRRAAKAYQSAKDSITKPSYNQRLVSYGSERRNQLSNIIDIATAEPGSGGLVFTVFEPQDLENRQRPGYVPCLVSGSFMLHEQEYQMNVFFRSQSILEFGLQDLIFLRKLQSEMVSRINDMPRTREKFRYSCGSLNIHFGRIVIQRRLMRNRQGFLRRETVVGDWMKVVGRFVEEGRVF